MRFATYLDEGRARVAVVLGERAVPLDGGVAGLDSIREIAASGPAGLSTIHAWLAEWPERPSRPIADLLMAPAVPDPGAIYAIGLNYGPAGGPDPDRPERPMVYAKLPGSVAGHGATLTWDRTLTAQRRRRGRAGRRHRRASPPRLVGRGHGSRLRLHLHQRRLVPRPVARRRPVAARQVDARLLPRGPDRRDRRRDRPNRPPPRLHDQRDRHPGWFHGPDALLDPGGDLLPQQATSCSDPATSSPPEPRLASPGHSDRTATCSPGTSPRSGSSGIGELTTSIA